MRNNFIKEKNCGGLAGHFGIDKTLNFLKERYFLPQLYKDVHKFVRSYGVSQVANGVSHNTRLYTITFVSEKPYNDINMDFFLGLPRTTRGNNFIFVVVDRFHKITHFIPYCRKTSDVVHVVDIFFK